MRVTNHTRSSALGLAFVAVGAIGLMSIETIAPAYASATPPREFVFAISSGNGLELIDADGGAATAGDRSQAGRRNAAAQLVCGHVMRLGRFSLGYACRPRMSAVTGSIN